MLTVLFIHLSMYDAVHTRATNYKANTDTLNVIIINWFITTL